MKHIVIRASAGTGKTERLALRFIQLVLDGHSPDTILAATFARKAAGEILERILVRVAEAADSSEHRKQLCERLQCQPLPARDFGVVLDRLVSQLHRLRIGTLDSFFVQTAASLGLDLGLPPGWRIVDDFDDAALRDEAIRQVLQNEPTPELLTLMHLLGRGELKSSVTRHIRREVRDLYGIFSETEADAWQALAPPPRATDAEFSAALAEVERLPPFSAVNFQKAHEKALRCLRIGDWKGVIEGQWFSALRMDDPRYSRKSIPAEVCETYAPVLRQVCAILIAQLADQTFGAHRLLSKFDATYRSVKHGQRAMRFEDVARTLSSALDAHRLDELAFRLDTRLSHLLLDEFQDTSLLQWSVLQPLAQRVTESRDGQSLFCVGDGKQAIYGWRGGVSEIFNVVQTRLRGIEEELLQVSFRSSQPVIDSVNEIFANLSHNQAVTDAASQGVVEYWRDHYHAHSTHRAELQGHVKLVVAPRAAEGEKADQATLAFAAQEIEHLAREHPACGIGVLTRRNATVQKLIHRLRTVHGVLASEEGGNPLTDSPAVQLILSLLTLADHPADTIARFHVAQSPLGACLGFTDFEAGVPAEKLARAIREGLLTEGYGGLVSGWAHALAPACPPREARRLSQLIELAFDYESRATLRPGDFVRFVQQRRVEDPLAARVRVMTIHQAKGLQFDIVVLPELDIQLRGKPPPVVVDRADPLSVVRRVCRYADKDLQELLPPPFPEMFARWSDPVVHESLCLLYVALTRAVHALHLVIAPSKENEQAWPSTFAGVLRSAFAADVRSDPGKVLVQFGEPDWKSPAELAAGQTRESASDTATLPPAARAPLTVRLCERAERQRSLERYSPSGLEGAGFASVRRLLHLDGPLAQARGQMLHAWFEQIEWLEDGIPDGQVLRCVAQRFDVRDLSISNEIVAWRKMLERPALAALLSRATYVSRWSELFPSRVNADPARPVDLAVWRERAFAQRRDGKLVQGVMDRVVVISLNGTPVAADLIDFKSDTVNTEAALLEAVELYRPQVTSYREALARILKLPLEQISGHLAFIGTGQLYSLSRNRVLALS